MLGVQLSCIVPALLKAHSSFVDRHHSRDSCDTMVSGTTVYIGTHGVAMVDMPWSKHCKLIDPTLIMSKEV